MLESISKGEKTKMSDITREQLTEAVEDEDLKALWATMTLPENFTIIEFFMKSLEAASIAAAKANEGLEAGKKILAYPPATNGAIAKASGGELFFPRSHSVASRVVVSLDGATPVVG
jgi:hypothetical protein